MANQNETQIEACAEKLYLARQTREPISPIKGLLPAGDIAAAYQVQSLNIARRIREGRRVVGRKIGLTSLAVQKQLGVDQPDFGVLLDDMAFEGDDVSISAGSFISPRIEAEIAFILKSDISRTGMRGAELEATIGSVAASAEIVDSAIADWAISIVDTIADNASSGAFALGSPAPYTAGMDLPARVMRLTRGDEVLSTGSGAATLGHPLNALAWLADTAVSVGAPLRAGDVILSGALGPMKPMTSGVYLIEIDGFPKLTVRVA